MSWIIGLIALAIILGFLAAYAPISEEWRLFLEKTWEIVIFLLVAIIIIMGMAIGVMLYWLRD